MNDTSRYAAASIEGAMSAFMRALAEVQTLASSGAAGPDIDDLLAHAGELLDIVEEELEHLDRADYAEAFEAAPVLRRKLDTLRAELGSGSTH